MPYAPKSLDKELDDAVLAFDLAGVGLCISRHWTIYRCNSEFSRIFGSLTKIISHKMNDGRRRAAIASGKMLVQRLYREITAAPRSGCR